MSEGCAYLCVHKMEVGVCVHNECIHVSGYVYTCGSIYLSVDMLEYMYIWVCVHMDLYSLGNTYMGEYPCVHTGSTCTGPLTYNTCAYMCICSCIHVNTHAENMCGSTFT